MKQVIIDVMTEIWNEKAEVKKQIWDRFHALTVNETLKLALNNGGKNWAQQQLKR
jgi:hypothetical protein